MNNNATSAAVSHSHDHNVQVHEINGTRSQLNKKVLIHQMINHGVDSFTPTEPHGFYFAFHNSTNYLASLFGIIFFFLPILPLIAMAIKLDSAGPIFYKQKRAGKNGLPFTMLKFRTMHKDADNGSKWTLKGDARVTRVGKLLRKFRLDELPQLINILKGEMALIGPRPEAVDLAETFCKEIPFYKHRYQVLQGITGWAQVNHENTCSIDGAFEKLQYDLYWIKHRSFLLDIKIIFKSIKVMFTGYGAV